MLLRCPFIQSRVHYPQFIAESFWQSEDTAADGDVSVSDVLRRDERGPHLDLDSTLFSLTWHAGLAGLTTLHIFELARFDAMLLSPWGFPHQVRHLS